MDGGVAPGVPDGGVGTEGQEDVHDVVGVVSHCQVERGLEGNINNNINEKTRTKDKRRRLIEVILE